MRVAVRCGLCLGALLFAVPAEAFTNDICLASQLWMLSGVRNDVFFKPFVKRWRPYDDFVRFSSGRGDMRFSRHLGHVVSIDEPVDGAVLTAALVNGDEFRTVASRKVTLRVGRQGVGTNEVVAQIVGDSFTRGQFFRDALVDSGYVPGLRLVGLLRGGKGWHDEGRGGWSLASYFGVVKRENQCYHGFMHPEDGRYWGSRAFWRMAWRCVRGTQPKGFEPSYSCARFDDVIGRLDESTGIPLDPEPGDVQYDNEAGRFVRFDGKAWKPVDGDALRWTFDYGKYLRMWGVEAPRFLFVVLGLNDWCQAPMNADFSAWGERIETFRRSYHAACPDGMFVICIPCSTCGSIDNAGGAFTPRQNAAMWRFRDWLIRTYDGREKDGFHLLDTGVAIDDDYGFSVAEGEAAAPYAKYAGKERLRIQTGNPHPYPNYPSMGVPLAAFIQYYRSR